MRMLGVEQKTKDQVPQSWPVPTALGLEGRAGQPEAADPLASVASAVG